MIYDRPRFAPGGDRIIEFELGDEMSFELNFLVHTLASCIRESRVEGVIELIPEMASIQVSYDPDLISYRDLAQELLTLRASIGDLSSLELVSRIYYVPILYFDPWTRECTEDYRAKLAEKEPDPNLLVQMNGLQDRAHLKRVHSGTEYWVAALGFWPGLCSLMPLDPRCRLTAPKYNPPRTWTPKGTVGMGGASTAIYPVATPGGYQIFARIPVPIWDTARRFPQFENSICLFKPGDRVKFLPVTVPEFEEAEARVKDGTYVYNVVEYQ